jgi:hypothetical protein
MRRITRGGVPIPFLPDPSLWMKRTRLHVKVIQQVLVRPEWGLQDPLFGDDELTGPGDLSNGGGGGVFGISVCDPHHPPTRLTVNPVGGQSSP